MSIGYACLTLGVRNAEYRTCRMENATEEKLRELIQNNLRVLETVVDYNGKNGIRLFRISSDLIPFASSPVNTLPWWEAFRPEFDSIGEKIRRYGIRVSMHPGQYTVLNSPDAGVVARAVEDLIYHTKVLDALGTDPSNKIILHVGGVYGNKPAAIERFVVHYAELPQGVKKRLVLENDDRSYPIGEVLSLAHRLSIPVVFDNLHNHLNPSDSSKTDFEWIREAGKTWKPLDGKPKIHYSQQDFGKQDGSHSATIGIDAFLEYHGRLPDVDVMLEVKDKNLSALKCLHCTRSDRHIKYLENEWGKYKYTILEKDPEGYNEIRRLLKGKTGYPALEFYRIIEQALRKESPLGNQMNAANHVFGYFKKSGTEAERQAFLRKLDGLQAGTVSLGSVKKSLWNLTIKYQEPYLLDSYYFVL
jgi:UV DNA damage endonuclease